MAKRESASGIALGRHQTFHLRAGWLVKALRALEGDPEALSKAGAHHDLGVGKNMLAAIRHWVVATELVERTGRGESRRLMYRPTPLASLLLRHDPYLEDAATQWVIHVGLASSETTAAAWYWFFNETDREQWSDGQLTDGLHRWLQEAASDLQPSAQAVRREVNCLLRTYAHEPGPAKSSVLDDQLTSPLATLDLVRRTAHGDVQATVGPRPSLPLHVLLYILQRFREPQGRTVFSLDELRWAPLSPGRLAGMDAVALWARLEQAQALEWSGVQVTTTAGLRNVTVTPAAPLQFLERYYDHAAA